MKNFIKSTVIILGVLIILLFIIIVFAITKKYNQSNLTTTNIVLNPKLEFNKKIKSFYVEKNKLVNALIISDADSMKNINKSARNIKNIKLIKDEGTNIYDLFKYKNVIITSSSAKKLQDRVLNEKN